MLKTLKGRTALAAAGLAAIGIITVTNLHSDLSEHTVLASGVAQHISYTQRVAVDIDRQLRLARAALSEFAANIDRSHFHNPITLHRFLNMAVGLQERFEAVSVFDAEGRLLASRPATEVRSVHEEAWFRDTIANNGVPRIHRPFLSPLSRKPVTLLTYPVHDESGRLQAVVVGAFALTQDELWIAKPSTDMRGESAFIVVTDDRYIGLHADIGLVGQPLDALGKVAQTIERGMAKEVASVIDEDHRGVSGLYAFREISSAGWTLVGVGTNEAAYASLAELSNRMLLAGAVLAMLLFPLMWLLVSRMLQPLDHLRSEMRRMRTGESGAPEVHAMRATTELSDLANEFAQVAAAWRTAEGALQREKERAEVIVESIGEGVIATDRHGVIAAMNGAAESIIGWRDEEVVGRPFVEVFVVKDEKHGVDLGDIAQLAMQQSSSACIPNALLRLRNGEYIPIHNSAAPIRNAEGEIDGAVIVFRNIAAERAAAQQLEWRATHDAMTGLVNRHAYEQALRRLCASVRPHESHALLVLDLDQFKLVNDTCGHAAGDALLKELADLFVRRSRRSDLVARLGGDEFAVVMCGCTSEQAVRLAETLLKAVAGHRFEWDGRLFAVGASIGVVEINADFCDPSEVVRAADMAAYMAKRSGGTRICNHSGSDEALNAMRLEMAAVSTIRAAIEADRLQLYAQAIHPVAHDGDGLYFEILVRMLDENGALLPPAVFMPAAERYGLMRQIDRWVIEHAARALAENFGPDGWHRLDTASINLSAITLKDGEIGAYILEHLERHGIPFERICFEITESAAIENLAAARELMQTLRRRGLRFALDDFGVGMTSLSQLRDLPIDVLKIDGSFICGIDRDDVNGPLVDAIQTIARKFSMTTVAERVETPAELAYLRRLGIEYAQGYLLARPVPLQQMIDSVATTV